MECYDPYSVGAWVWSIVDDIQLCAWVLECMKYIQLVRWVWSIIDIFTLVLGVVVGMIYSVGCWVWSTAVHIFSTGVGCGPYMIYSVWCWVWTYIRIYSVGAGWELLYDIFEYGARVWICMHDIFSWLGRKTPI